MAKVIEAETTTPETQVPSFETWETWVWTGGEWDYADSCSSLEKAHESLAQGPEAAVIIHVSIPAMTFTAKEK